MFQCILLYSTMDLLVYSEEDMVMEEEDMVMEEEDMVMAEEDMVEVMAPSTTSSLFFCWISVLHLFVLPKEARVNCMDLATIPNPCSVTWPLSVVDCTPRVIMAAMVTFPPAWTIMATGRKRRNKVTTKKQHVILYM